MRREGGLGGVRGIQSENNSLHWIAQRRRIHIHSPVIWHSDQNQCKCNNYGISSLDKRVTFASSHKGVFSHNVHLILFHAHQPCFRGLDFLALNISVSYWFSIEVKEATFVIICDSIPYLLGNWAWYASCAFLMSLCPYTLHCAAPYSLGCFRILIMSSESSIKSTLDPRPYILVLVKYITM